MTKLPEAAYDRFTAEIARLKAEVSALKQQLSGAQDELEDSWIDNAHLKSQLEEARKMLEESDYFLRDAGAFNTANRNKDFLTRTASAVPAKDTVETKTSPLSPSDQTPQT